MGEKEKAPKFRGFVRKQVSILGITSWVSEVRTTHFEQAGECGTSLEATALAIRKAAEQRVPLQLAA